ncbi:MAG TPA: hypothetical protein VFF69_03210 [Phycisphaerales bacterium]|nr:hypothetical protein [Phycisphaerales bacterium]
MTSAERGQYVTVVSGLPRSGTSMMMAMLGAGGVPALTDGVRAPDEDNRRGYYEYEPVKRLAADASWIGEARGRAVKVVIPLVRRLPAPCACRVLLMRRPVEEVIASQRVMLGRAGRRGGRIEPELLGRLYEAELRTTEAWLDARPDVAWLAVSYNGLVADSGPAVREIGEFLGGGLDEGAMLAAVEPSLYRQRGAGGRGAVRAREGDRP